MDDPLLKQKFYRRIVENDFMGAVVNYLFGEPLYGFYVITVALFYPDDIQGLLMTHPMEFYGPFATFECACAILDEMYKESTNIAQS